MMRDIETGDDILLLMQCFYKKAMADEEIGFYFTQVAPLDLPHHLPVITAFWKNVLFNDDSYHGNPMQVHHHLHQLHAFTEAHFKRWLHLFCTTADELFTGDNTERIKQRATSIATVMKIKIVYQGIQNN